MSRLNGFNGIARIYDPLKRLVFGETLLKSQLHFLSSVPAGATVLILGGGTGEILIPLIRQDVRRIFYVEASSQMLLQARERVRGAEADIIFIHGTHEALPSGLQFDVIITNFFLDLFPDAVQADICQRLLTVLREHGVWLVSDFVHRRIWWQGVLLRIMYAFFNLTADVQAKSLPFWENHLRDAGLVEKASGSYFNGFVKTALYRRPDPTFSAGAAL